MTESGGGRAGGGPSRAGAGSWGAIAVLVIVLLLGLGLWIAVRGARRDVLVTTRGGAAVAPGPLGGPPRGPAGTGAGAGGAAPGIADQGGTFDGCPVDGDGGDRALNRLKNRTATGAWRDVPLDSILARPWPPGTEGRNRARWPAAARRAVAPLESRTARVEGYLVRAKQSGPESTNCHGKAARYRDYHLWLTDDPSLGREASVIAEMTPRVRAVHERWNLKTLNGVVRRRERVRVSGWLLYDQEHPEQIGRTRGTLWEVHPVMELEVRRGSRWIPLDALRD